MARMQGATRPFGPGAPLQQFDCWSLPLTQMLAYFTCTN